MEEGLTEAPPRSPAPGSNLTAAWQSNTLVRELSPQGVPRVLVSLTTMDLGGEISCESISRSFVPARRCCLLEEHRGKGKDDQKLARSGPEVSQIRARSQADQGQIRGLRQNLGPLSVAAGSVSAVSGSKVCVRF